MCSPRDSPTNAGASAGSLSYCKQNEMDLRCRVYQAHANNELHQVSVIERRCLPRDIAACEEHPGHNQDACCSPALIVACKISP